MIYRGDIVLVPFPYTNFQGSKIRPAVVLFETPLDYVVCYITTNIYNKEIGDVLVKANRLNRLKFDSLIRGGRITTIEKYIVLGASGELVGEKFKELCNNLIAMLNVGL